LSLDAVLNSIQLKRISSQSIMVMQVHAIPHLHLNAQCKLYGKPSSHPKILLSQVSEFMAEV
jgi:hypothetical protein